MICHFSLTFNAKAMRLYNKVDRKVLKEVIDKDPRPRITLSFYKYAHILNPPLFRDHLYILLSDINVLGRIYISSEGINAQISVLEEYYNRLVDNLDTISFLRGVRLNKAIEDNGKSFYKLKIKLRNKIVADDLDESGFDVTDRGQHLTAEEFNNLSESEDSIIVDMRNHYESEVGHFENAITPDVETFREALPYVENILAGKEDKNIIMYCTGGIRCEKASAYFKHKGFSKVYQLEGGIIEYARQAKENKLPNKFKGKNFVFDERLGEKISDEVISSCHQCGDSSDTHVNCANDACHILFIQCDNCQQKWDGCCSEKCRDFIKLPSEKQEKLRKEMEFNGTKFGKGRYKANRKNEPLDMD